MQVTFYKNSSNYNVINKQLEEMYTLDFEFKMDVSILHPVLILKNYKGGNYCYIDVLNRYYYVENDNILKGNLYSLDLLVDVLYSYNENIMGIEYIDSDNKYMYIDSLVNFKDYYDINKFTVLIGG